MKKLTSLFFAAAVSLPLFSGENLLQNPGFEDAKTISWEFWPGPASLSTENPASGQRCVSVPALPDKGEYLLQKKIPVEPGFAYAFSLKSRSNDCKKPLKISLVFRNAEGAVANTVTVAARDVSKDWSMTRGAALAPASAATVDVSIVIPSGNGTFHIDDVSLEKGSRILGVHGGFRVEPAEKGLRIVTPSCTLDFIEKRNFGLASAGFGEKRRIRNFFLYVPVNDKIQSSFFFSGNIVSGLKATEQDGSFDFTVEESYPHLKAERSIECWDDKPYIKFTCRLEALKDFTCPRVSMDFGFTGSLIAQGRGSRVKYTKWTKPGRWFNLERPDDPRVISYLDKDGKNGIALIGLDKVTWDELPGKLLSSTPQKAEDGFGIGLVKWTKREIRKGDQISYEVLIAPVENHEEAVKLADQFSQGN